MEGVITSDEVLNMEFLPDSMVIIGAGVIGLEFATMLSRLGVKITVIESNDRILANEDSEVAEELLKLLKRQGISFKLSAKVSEIHKTDDRLAVHYTLKEK